MPSAANIVILSGLLIGLVYGAVGLLSGFCMMSGLRGWWAQGYSRLVRSYALAMGVAIAATQLLAAGHETTANLVGNAVLTFQAQPGQARLLREHPELIPAAVEELIRFESPVQVTARTAKENVEVGTATVTAGEQVLVCVGAANRDPAVFAEPDHLDFGRGFSPHLGFGNGLHFCAGASLARVEAQEVLRHLLTLSPPMEERRIAFERGTSPALRRVTTLLLSADLVPPDSQLG